MGSTGAGMALRRYPDVWQGAWVSAPLRLTSPAWGCDLHYDLDEAAPFDQGQVPGRGLAVRRQQPPLPGWGTVVSLCPGGGVWVTLLQPLPSWGEI